MSHEVITGVRPFLPNMAPVAWYEYNYYSTFPLNENQIPHDLLLVYDALFYLRMKHVRKKSPEHICAYQTQEGNIEFSSHLFPQNHISR